MENFGWPCYEGDGGTPGYDDLNLNICENLYGQANAVSAPHFAYIHGTQVAGESCATGNGSSISGLAFYKGGPYPDEYDDALFFSDYSRRCIWVMEKGTNGLPNPGKLKPFVTGAASPVDLQIGPNGDLFYVDFDGGKIWRVQYAAANQPPIARATANPTSGAVPLAVSFDGTGSSDPEGSTLTYEWDLDGDGAFDDSTSSQPTYTYNTAGNYQVGLRVTDGQGASDTLDQPLTISAGNTAPTATIDSPSSTTTWKVGDNISFSGSATDQQDGSLAASRSDMVPDHAPLLLTELLPRARGAGLRGSGERLVRCAGPRVPLLPGAPAHCHRLGRAQRHQERAARPQDRGVELPVRPRRAPTDRRQR